MITSWCYLYSASDEVSLNEVDIALIAVGVLFLVFALVAAISVAILVAVSTKKSCGMFVYTLYHHWLTN